MKSASANNESFKSLSDFYVFYLKEHSNAMCRRLHFVGSVLTLLVLFYALFSQSYGWLFCLPLIGYSFAWIGHFVFEKNKPATFKHPFYSFVCDWMMFKDIFIGKIAW
ncbi:MAG: Mpo1-like protein [Pseudomonadota bacterium]